MVETGFLRHCYPSRITAFFIPAFAAARHHPPISFCPGPRDVRCTRGASLRAGHLKKKNYAALAPPAYATWTSYAAPFQPSVFSRAGLACLRPAPHDDLFHTAAFAAPAMRASMIFNVAGVAAGLPARSAWTTCAPRHHFFTVYDATGHVALLP